MNIAISNIAWPRQEDPLVADCLARNGIVGIEVAPTKICPNMETAEISILKQYQTFWAQHGIQIVAAQALLFGRPDLTLFDDEPTRQATLRYLKTVIRVCVDLGASVLVFGSPKNRNRRDSDSEETLAIGVAFFGALAELAQKENAVIVIEANPKIYHTNYITSAQEALQLVTQVNHPHFQLHLDTGCMTLSHDDIRRSIHEGASVLKHFHVSEPHLDPIGNAGVQHELAAKALQEIHYPGWISIEMKERAPFSIQQIENAILKTTYLYGNTTTAAK